MNTARIQRWMTLGVLSLAMTGAATANAEDRGAGFASAIEAAHNAAGYYRHAAVRATISLSFGGQPIFDGAMLFDTPVGRSRFELSDGTLMVFDGQHAWVTPADSPMLPQARFHVLTWPYFLAAPFKLSDPGVTLGPDAPRTYQGVNYPTARMTFAPGTGDSPDDWYILYRHPRTHRLDAMAYIVTFDTPQEKAEAEPHAIVYRDWVEVEGVTLARHFLFYHWNPKQGIHGDPIGEVKLSDIQFVTPDEDAFTKPDGAAESKRPDEAG